MLNGNLFTRDFLIEGIRDTQAWGELDDARVDDMRRRVEGLFAAFGKLKRPTEAETEKELIWPLLALIGWTDMSVQPNLSTRAREDVPDALLFGNAAAKNEAAPLDQWQRFEHGLCIVEAKRWNRVLDREEARRRGEEGVPSTQMLRYLRRVDDVTDGKLRWGILTNGRHWRLYFRGALSVAEDFLEIDLGTVFGLEGCEPDLLDKRPDSFASDAAWQAHAFRLFLLVFGREAFVPGHRGDTFHQLALREGKQWEARVARDLSDTVFDHVFPRLGEALAIADGKSGAALDAAAIADVREGALILLYRLLFVLYAEDRNLLPDENGPYADYSITRLRAEIAEKMASGARPSERMTSWWSRLHGVFQAIAHGDDSLGIPPYNGGLFDPAAAPILGRVQLPDAVVADVVFRLSHIDIGDGRPPKYINYRDLSVQQLGSVYERVLEHGLKVEDGKVVVADNPAARKSSGSYYTPEELVALIIGRAVGPLVAARIAAFTVRAAALESDTRGKEARLAELLPLDPASRLLELKICDPAMGSGHFLVSLVDWLADRVLEAMAESAASVHFAAYVSPLADRIKSIRGRILAQAKAHGWPIAEAQLDDRKIVRRMVLKRVVYGVDKNPMAVELAKVALWLHSFTVGAPLSFLDHHLRCGDSVLGAWVRPTVDALVARGALFGKSAIARVEQVAGLMEGIEEMTDSDIAEVTASKTTFGLVEEATIPVAALFSVLMAERMMGIFAGAPKKAPLPLGQMATKSAKQLAVWREQVRAFEAASSFQLALEGVFGDPVRIAAGDSRIAEPELVRQIALLPADATDPQSSLFPGISVDDRRRVLADRLVADARARAAQHGFFHWEIGFPNVWSNLISAAPAGGFDAVIGNPPYVRQELLGEEAKRALKADYTAFDGMADLYVYFYEQGLRLLRPGGRMSYVVTNKWLKAGYAESLRDLFASKGQIEFVADFGHARHFFPDADVFPSVVVIRKPVPDEPAPSDTEVCVIPRDAVPEKGLSAAVAAATYPLPRAHFTKESWTLEPPDVVALLDKIRRNGVPLTEYVGAGPINGVKTGLNEAFRIDSTTRERLAKDDPKCVEIIRPYRRGQDIERWVGNAPSAWMICLAPSPSVHRPWSDLTDTEAEQVFARLFPAIHSRFRSFENNLRSRASRGKFWWELQTSPSDAAYSRSGIIYQEIQFYSCYALNEPGVLSNNKTFVIPSSNKSLLVTLNSPLLWWHNWRFLPHMKDEALSPMAFRMEHLPIASARDDDLESDVDSVITRIHTVRAAAAAMHDWLRHELGLDKPGRALGEPHKLDPDAFVTAVRAAVPRKRKLSVAEIARLNQEYTETLTPARNAAAEILALERKLSDLVNAAYGLTPEEVALMWRTTPPRMPLDPAEELRRLPSRSAAVPRAAAASSV